MDERLRTALDEGWQRLISINHSMSNAVAVTGSCSGFARKRGPHGYAGRLADGTEIADLPGHAVEAQFEKGSGVLLQLRCHMMADETHARACACCDYPGFEPTPCPVLQRIIDARGGRP